MSARPWWRSDAPWVHAGCVLAAWIAALYLEQLVVVALHHVQIAGSWETRAIRLAVAPVAIACLLPAAFVAVGLARLAASRRAPIAALAAVAGALTGYGVSYGRHMASLAVRAPFVIAVGAAAGGAAFWATPHVVRAARARPRGVALVAALLAMLAWCADALILPRLYPAFHAALAVITMGLAALVALAFRSDAPEEERAPAVVAGLALALGLVAAIATPRLARQIASADNVRMFLVERAPLLGRAVAVAAVIAPPAPLEVADVAPLDAPGELPRALDWTGRDLVLVTVDALRADHLGAYGYARPTTPALDALAQGGARFDAAYCPTPHTSYSITSLMTGKYMRPLVAMGLGDDSDTWAGLLRKYGYRTAAFFPPAVFFIDGERFRALHDRNLDFEYVKEEFAAPDLRARQVAAYLASAPHDKPLFVWVHFFEPHEPYVAHPEHPFGSSDVDRYDSEIAAADDGIGVIVRQIRAARPGAVVIATADHGEEFGEHGGRYHGTSVYEEQVRVPLLVEGRGVVSGVVRGAVQTIDLLPTVLSALGIPRPARLRGRDLGPALARREGAADDPGFALAETDEYAMVARGDERLVCERRAAACALFDRARDPGEKHDVASERPDDARDLRRAMAAVSGGHGRFERGEGAAWPEALRRGIAGDADAAEDVAALLDDANAGVRAKAAEVSFDLHAPLAAAAMRRAVDKSDDDRVKRWCALALVRMGEPAPPLAEALARDADAAWRRRAALAFAERGDARGAAELASWWADRGDLDFTRATEVLAALAKIRDRGAVPVLARSLDDVRLRPFVADALATIGDPAARPALAAALATEAQVTARAREAHALAALGGAAWTADPVAPRVPRVEAKLAVPRGATRARLVVLAAGAAPCAATWNGVALAPSPDPLDAHVFDLPPAAGGATAGTVTVEDEGGVAALFVVAAPAP